MSSRQRAEATGKAKTTPADAGPSVTWRGSTFHLPRPQDTPLEALEAEEDGKHLRALRLILGELQYATFRSLAATAGDVEDFSAVVMAELGPGNP
ncbi:MAG: hypothetical protein ACRDIC_16745 [bacterium]